MDRRKLIYGLASLELGRQGPYGGNPDAWCGVFVCHVLRRAGLTFEGDKGAELIRQLGTTQSPELGDVAHWPVFGHFALYVRRNAVTNSVLMIHGGARDDRVALTSVGARVVVYYSLDVLLERAEWTGASTGDIG